MKIERQIIKNPLDRMRCYVHARGLILPTGFGLITMQKLELSGCDVFYGIEMIKTTDGGLSYSDPVLCKNLVRRYDENRNSTVLCDATPFYHQKSGKIILTGQSALYSSTNKLAKNPRPRDTLYAVYNEETGDFDGWERLNMPQTAEDAYFSSGAGCSQISELPNGELLIPIYHKSRAMAEDNCGCFSVAVLRCSFDGKKLDVLEIGPEISIDIPRGFYEPSIVRYGDRYLLALRNDVTGYVASSRDGLNFDTPRELCFENGENLGNYNTQQHWLVGGGKLWLVYTRKAGNNDHMFRHRAPLFIAEFDAKRMCVIRETEQIVVPERGARLGNFGCQSYSEEEGYVFAAEWMQNHPYSWEKCVERGSDNSIFVSKITYL
ncbi:MAG: exo-alpha-sialidase [Clostridia bacterium]|nr:exo-alpha-sialidase [Clostridia bacterium]